MVSPSNDWQLGAASFDKLRMSGHQQLIGTQLTNELIMTD